MLTKDSGLCIRAVDYSETSQILTLFTRANGKISAIAKGSKRPKSAFDGPVETFSYGKIVFSVPTREKLATLTEFEQQPWDYSLANDLFALNCCLFGAELVDKLTNEYDPHPQLFDSFLQFLQNINKIQDTLHEPRPSEEQDEPRDTLSLLILFQLTLLKEVGLMPVLDACVNCKSQYTIHNTQYDVYFSSSANGLICRDCEASFPDKIGLSKTAANTLSNLKTIADASSKVLNEIEKTLIHHFTETLGRAPKMAKYILKNFG